MKSPGLSTGNPGTTGGKMKNFYLNVRAQEPGTVENDPETICQRIKELGADGFVLTQRGIFPAADEWLSVAEKYHLKMVPGLMADLWDSQGCIVLIPKDEAGRKAIMLAAQARQEGDDSHAVLERSILYRFFGKGASGHDHVIALTGGIDGCLYKAKDKKYMLSLLIKVLGKENVFFQIPGYKEKKWAAYIKESLPFVKSAGIKICAADDVLIAKENSRELLQIQLLSSKKEGRWLEKINPAGRTLRTEEETVEALKASGLSQKEAQDAINVSDRIFRSCEGLKEEHASHYASYVPGEDPLPVLLEKIQEGIRKCFPSGLPDTYKKCLKKELTVIQSLHFENYFLIVADFVQYARLLEKVPEEKIREAPLSIPALSKWINENHFDLGYGVGPSRGSAGASLVCMLLGITKTDPVKEDLDFDRFLSPARTTMPDIDVDLSTKIRGKVVEYLRRRYGDKAICLITVKNRYSAKSAVLEAGRLFILQKGKDKTMGKEEKEKTEKLSRMISSAIPEGCASFSDLIQAPQGHYQNEGKMQFPVRLDRYLAGLFPSGSGKTLIWYAAALEGCLSSFGTHPSGVILSDAIDIGEIIPLRKNGAIPASWSDQIYMERKGFLKMDLLSSRALSLIDTCIRRIFETEGIMIHPDFLPKEDEKTFRMLREGETAGIFQLEGEGMTKLAKKFAPSSMEDLMILISLYRPGPLQYADDVIAAKNGGIKKSGIPALDGITGNTYGYLIYQEQILSVLKKIGGYSAGDADNVRRYISHKEADRLSAQKDIFVRGAGANGIDESRARALFESMKDFGRYAFNRAHAAGYAREAYIMAYLKAHFPAQFAAAALKYIPSDPGQRKRRKERLLRYVKKCGISILPPDVNVSGMYPESYSSFLQLGIHDIQGMENIAGAVVSERKNGPYTSIFNLLDRVPLSKENYRALIEVGALDSFCNSRVALLASQGNIYDAAGISRRRSDTKQKNCLLSLKEQEVIPVGITDRFCDRRILAIKEFQRLGSFLTYHPWDEYSLSGICGLEQEQELCGCICDIRIVKSKAGKETAFAKVLLDGEDLDAAVFEESCIRYLREAEEFSVVTIKGKLQQYKGRKEVIIKEIQEAGKKKQKEAVYRLPCSYPVFHILYEEKFRNLYERKGGRELVFINPDGTRLKPGYHVRPDFPELEK